MVAYGLRYHRIVLLVTAALVAFGVYGLLNINKNEFPDFTIRQGVVVAVYPGADATEIEQEVLKPLEDFIFSFKEVDKASTSSRAVASMALVFVNLDDNIDATDQFWNKFNIALQQFKPSLPAGVVALRALTDFSSTSSLLITMESSDKTYRQLHDYMTALRDRLRPIESVGQMTVYGDRQEQIAVYVDNQRLSHYGLKANALAATLMAQGFSTTAGRLKSPVYTTPIYVDRSVNSVADLQNMIVLATPSGDVVRLGDVARVVREYPEPEQYITNNGVKCLVLSVSMKEGHNVVSLGREVDRVLQSFEQTLPDDVTLFKITDQPTVVNSSVKDFLQELLIAIIAVVVVIMLLLPMRVALIAAATIPVTIFIAIGILYAFGVQLNTVTLACLIVSLGMIVDNSVVIIDNYVELISEGVDRRTATYRSAVEFLKAIVSATLAISITFFPFLLTMTGMFRDFLTDFPWAITIILLVSLLVAEMVVPWVQYRLIRRPIYKLNSEAIASGKKKFSFFVALQNLYDRLIGLCFAWPKTVIGIGLAAVVTGAVIFVSRPLKLMPIAERNQFAVEIYMPTGAPLSLTNQVADSLASILRADPRVVSVAVFHGCSSPRFQDTYAPQVGGENYAQFIVNTVSDKATVELLDEYTPRFDNFFPDAYCRFKQLDYSTADYPIEVRISGNDYRRLQSVADSILERMRAMPGLRLVRPSTSTPQLAALVEPNRAKTSRLGLNNLWLEATLAMRYSSGLPVATVWESDYGVDVVVKTDRAVHATLSQLADEPIPVMQFASAPLRQFATVNPQWDFGRIDHYGGVPTITIIAENQRDVNTMQLTSQVRQAIDDLRLADDVTVSYGGDWQNTMDLLPQMLSALAIAVVIIFFIILFHYRHVAIATILLAALALCLPGAALGLLCMDTPISLTCTLGLISLMGILVRNAIIMIDYAEQLQRQSSLDNREAALQSAKRRMRPIFLTSAAATMGVLPMVIAGSALWQPMGTVIFFGTPLTMLLTLTVIPVALWKFGGRRPLTPTSSFDNLPNSK